MPVCNLLQHKEAINNTKQFLVDTGGLKSMQSTEIADVALLRQGLKKLESLSIKSYGIPGRPWLEDSNGTNVYPNGKVLHAIDRVRRARGLYEGKFPANYKPPQQVVQQPQIPQPVSVVQAESQRMTNQNVDYQVPSTEGQIASEKTIRDLAARISDRIGIPYRIISDGTQQFKGKLQSGEAVINLAYATLDTPIHEILGHPIIKAIKNRRTDDGGYVEQYNNAMVEFEDKNPNATREEMIAYADKKVGSTPTDLYQNLLKELETGRGKEVFDRIKRDYAYKTKFNRRKNKYEKIEITLEEQQEEAIVELLGMMTAEKLDAVKDGKLISLLKRLLKEMKQFVRSLLSLKEVEINKLPDNMTIGDIADLLAYSNSKLILPGYEVEYTTPDNMKFKTYAEASNHISQLVKSIEDVDLSDVKIEKKTLAGEIDPITGKKIKSAKFKWGSVSYFSSDDNQYEPGEPDSFEIVFEDDTEYTVDSSDLFRYYDEETRQFYDQIRPSGNSIESFIESNKEYEQSKEVIKEWKKVNGIQYNPEEIYSRGQEFVSVVGAYSNFDVNLMMQNLLQHIEDNEKAGGEFTISAFTKPIDKTIGHLEGRGGKIKFKIYPQSQDIKWAANTDVYSGSVWDAAEKVNKDKKSELLGVSYTKYPSLDRITAVQPNLAFIVDRLAHHHNELGISLNGTNFRLEYDEDIPYQTKKIIDSINSILDQKYGKLVKPEIKKIKNNIGKKYLNSVIVSEENLGEGFSTYTLADGRRITEPSLVAGVEPTQTEDNLKESIEYVKDKISGVQRFNDSYNFKKFVEDFEYIDFRISEKDYDLENFYSLLGILKNNEEHIIENLPTKELAEYRLNLYKNKVNKKYTEQALINTKIAKLKEVAKKYPRSLISSKVVEIKEQGLEEVFDVTLDDLTWQKIPNLQKFQESLANKVYEALGFQGNVSLESNLKNTGKTEQELIDYLKQKYPEIKLDISNNPVWEQGLDIFNQREKNRIAYLSLIQYYSEIQEEKEYYDNLSEEEKENLVLNEGRANNLYKFVENPSEFYNEELGEYDYKYSDFLTRIQENYEKAIGRTSNYRGNLQRHIASGNAVVYKPFLDDDSLLAGQKLEDMLIVSHLAPSSLRQGVLLIQEASDSMMPIIMAVPEYQSEQLKKSGFRFITQIPQYFAGDIVMKNVMVNKATTENDLEKLFEHFSNHYNQENEANQIIGQANIKAMTVLVDAINKKADTIPHEYAHHYIAWFRNTPIVQEGIKRFGSEEALVQAIGEQVVTQKGEAYNWWKKFTNWILNLLSDKQLLQILTDSFLNRQDLNEFTYNNITPQQKQQALQVYSEFLQSLANPNTNPILQESPEEQLKKFQELQERLSNKEFLEASKAAYESSPELQQTGTLEEYNDYIARVSVGIFKNPSSDEYNNSQVKDIVYHYGRVPKDNKFIHFGSLKASKVREFYASSQDKVRFASLINIANPLNKKDSGDESPAAFIKDVHNAGFDTNISQDYDVPTGDEWFKVKRNYPNKSTFNGKIIPDQDDKKAVEQRLLNSEYDGFAYINTGEGTQDVSYVVFEPEQIHILASKQDIEGFKNFTQPKISNELENIILSELQNKSTRTTGIDTSVLSDGKQVLWGSLNSNESGTSRTFVTTLETVPVGYSDTLRERTAGRSFNEVWSSREFSQLEREQILFASIVERLTKSPNSFNGKLFKYIKEKFGQLESDGSKQSGIRFIDQSELPPLFVSNGYIYVNRSFYQYINALNIANLDEYLEISLSEELIHLVTDNLMTNEEYLNILAEIPSSVRQKVQVLYPSVNFEDPVNSLTLIDEYLRMLIQESIFGKTTELVKSQSSEGLSLLERAWEFIKGFLRSNYDKSPFTASVVNKSLSFISESQRAAPTYYQLSPNEINYQLKTVSIITNNIQQINKLFSRLGNTDQFWNKIQQDFQIPKDQLNILRNEPGSTIEEKLSSFAANYSFAVEINIAKKNYNDDGEDSNEHFELNVPGGTNYKINVFKTPLILPSIINHFFHKNQIGWFRSDEKIIGGENIYPDDWEGDSVIQTGVRNLPVANIGGTPTKTRRIIEVQSDLFQKGRDKENLISKKGKYYRVLNINIGDNVTFQPNSYSEAFEQNEDGKWYPKYNKSGYYLRSQIPEISASKNIGSAIMGNWTASGMPTNAKFFIYELEDSVQPDYDISHVEFGDFKQLQEVRYRKPVNGKLIGEFQLTPDIYETFSENDDLMSEDGGMNKHYELEDKFEKEFGYRPYDEKAPDGAIDKFNTIQDRYWKEQSLKIEKALQSIHNKYDEQFRKNQFLQLLKKDNNWVTFFIRALIQDSAKKGYEKVLFPTGSTASKIEGHTTLEEFKKIKEDRLKQIEGLNDTEDTYKTLWLISPKGSSGGQVFTTKEEAEKEFRNPTNPYIKENINLFELKSKKEFVQGIKYSIEREQLKQELERVETEGFGALKPIYNFYENTVFNILKKQGYKPVLITDEYGNTWYEVAVDQTRDTSPIQLQMPSVEVKETSLTSEVRQKLLEFAKKAGIKIEVLGNLLATRGANGLADIKNMLIQLQQGKEDFALAEEVAHFFVEGLDPNSQMYQEMMALAPYTRLYQVVASEYAEAYRGDKEMLKKETMGKLISLYLTDKQQFEYWVAPAGTSLFRKVVEWIRSFLKLTNKNKKYKSFIRAAEQILDVNTDGLNWNSQTELVFFNKVPSRSFVTLDGKQLPEDKKTLINLNDTIFDYKGFTFGSADNLERKRNLAGNDTDLNTYYNSVELTPFGRELVDKIAAGLINIDNLEFYTSLTITDALKNRLSTIIGKSPTIHKSESLDFTVNQDRQTIPIQTTTKQFLENYARENPDVFIIDNRVEVTEPNNPNFHKYNPGIKYIPEAQRARIDNIRKDRERAAKQFETLGNGVISNFIIQAHIKLFSGGGLKRAIEYMENALNKISNDEVVNLFKDSQGRIVIPLDNASKARDLIQKADKTLEAIIQFVGTLEGIASFYDIILENAKKIDADNITDEQVDALIFEMNKVANISEYWLSYTEEILEELRAKSGVEEATRVVSRVKTAIEQAQNEILKKSRDVVAKKLENQIEGYNYGIVARIKDIERMIADRKTSKGTALSDKDIEALEKEKTDLETKHKMSAEKIINILTGREKDITAITTWIKALPNTGDPVIASVGKLLRVVEQETQMTTLVQTQKFAQEMQDIMKKYNLSQDDIEEFLLTQETYRLYNPETETFENKQRMAFLNPFKDRHEFVEKMQAVNEARKAWYDSIKTGEDPELKEEYFRRKTDFEKFKLEHWNQDYTEAYYQRYDAIKEEFGQEMFEKAMEKVSTIYDEISLIEDSIIDETVENEEKAYERIRDLRRELAFLKMTVNEDGTLKVDEDVQIARLLQKKSEVDSEIFEYNIDHKKFQEAVLSLINSYDVEPQLKSQIEQALTDQNYSKVQTLASSIDSRIVSWFELNTINKPGEKFYDQRNKITDKLNDLFIQLDKIAGREPSSTISELWREIFTLSRPYRDEDGNINASAIPRALQQKITDFNQQIEDYRQQAESDMSSLNLSETQQKDLAEVRKQIREQVQELRKIQKKEETTEYLEEFEKYANASPAFSRFRETAINDKQAAKDFVDLYPDDSFSEWFLANHYLGTKKNFFEQEVVDAYYPSYIWTKVEPIDSTLVEVIPTIKYGKREIKQAYHTKKIDFVTWSPVTQRWLPKSSKYKNPKYQELIQRSRVKGSKEEGLFELLNKMTAFHLETQVNSVTKAKLEWFIPSVQKRALEGNIITNAYGKFIDRGNTFEEEEGNFEQSERVAPTAKQRLKQFMSRISSYLESGYWRAPETVKFDERSGQYVEVKREIPVMYTGYMDPEDVSKDVLMSTVLFRESVNKANELRNNLPTINLLEKILANTPNQKNRAEAIKFIKENKFHGVNKQYEVGKGLDDFLRHMRKLYRIGSQSDLFGFFNTIKNSFQGRLQNYINAEFHGWSSGKAMRKAASYHKNNLWFFLGESEKPLDQRSKDWFLQAFINPGNFEKLLLYTQPGAMKKFSSDNFMFLSTATFEYAISVNALYAHLFHKELSRTSPSGEKEVKKLYDIITIKDNQPFIDPNEGWVDEIGRPIDSAYLIRMKTQLTSILEYTQGKTAEMTKLNTTTIGTAVLFFKSWVIPSLRRRFDMKRANYVLDRDLEGYWLTFARLSFLMLKNLKAYGESNWNTFTEEDKANYFTALREITVMLASTLIITLGFGFDPDDEDKYKKVKEMDFFSQTALLIAVQTKLETEGLSPFPGLKLEGGIIPPVLSEAPKYFTNPVIGMPIIADTFKLIDNLTKLLSGEESAYYDRNMPQYNIEKGESKASHFFIKLAQLDDLLYTWENPEGRLEVLVGMAKR